MLSVSLLFHALFPTLLHWSSLGPTDSFHCLPAPYHKRFQSLSVSLYHGSCFTTMTLVGHKIKGAPTSKFSLVSRPANFVWPLNPFFPEVSMLLHLGCCSVQSISYVITQNENTRTLRIPNPFRFDLTVRSEQKTHLDTSNGTSFGY